MFPITCLPRSKNLRYRSVSFNLNTDNPNSWWIQKNHVLSFSLVLNFTLHSKFALFEGFSHFRIKQVVNVAINLKFALFEGFSHFWIMQVVNIAINSKFALFEGFSHFRIMQEVPATFFLWNALDVENRGASSAPGIAKIRCGKQKAISPWCMNTQHATRTPRSSIWPQRRGSCGVSRLGEVPDRVQLFHPRPCVYL